jgi:hypothetical protein
LQKPRRKASGPSTELGKQRAKERAETRPNTAFFQALLLPGESWSEYKKLLAAKRAAYQTKSEEEERVVQDLTDVEGRRRRLHLAEWAVVRISMEPGESNRGSLEKALEELTSHEGDERLIERITDPDVRKTCLQLLLTLRQGIEQNGFRRDVDAPLLGKIYGARDAYLFRGDLFDAYERWQLTSMVNEEERQRCGYASPERCRECVIREILQEIDR